MRKKFFICFALAATAASPLDAETSRPNLLLHDLKNDPDELTNLANDPQYADILRQYQQRTEALATRYADALAP